MGIDETLDFLQVDFNFPNELNRLALRTYAAPGHEALSPRGGDPPFG